MTSIALTAALMVLTSPGLTAMRSRIVAPPASASLERPFEAPESGAASSDGHGRRTLLPDGTRVVRTGGVLTEGLELQDGTCQPPYALLLDLGGDPVFLLLRAGLPYLAPLGNVGGDAGTIGRKVARVYRSTVYLSFKSIVTETEQRPTGELIPPQEKAHATVAMAAGGKVRLTVIDPRTQKCVLERACDGSIVTDWNEQGRKTVPITEGDDAHVEADFDFCYVGGVLTSWVGPQSDQPQLFEERISGGTLKGILAIDGTQCYVLEFERRPEDGFLVRDTFYIDRKQWFVRQWTTMQAQISQTGRIESHITRQRRYFDIATEKLPDETFTVPLGIGARFHEHRHHVLALPLGEFADQGGDRARQDDLALVRILLSLDFG